MLSNPWIIAAVVTFYAVATGYVVSLGIASKRGDRNKGK
jgi:hypothetical protein